MAASEQNGSSESNGASGRPPLRFGVLQFFSWPNRNVPLPVIYQRNLERVDLMESSGGYEAVWLAEHHFNTYSVCPSVHIMGTHVAARTKRLRIGTAVSLAGMYHPLRLAEEVALLDVLSGGRVNWGAGRGNDATEFTVFGLDRELSYAKLREHVEVVLAAWRNERVTYHGRFIDVDGVEVLPKPLQQPHPPVWLAASSVEAIEWAAQEGFSILMDPHSSHVEIGRKYGLYRQGLVAAGHNPEGRTTPMARLVAVGPTDAAGEETARRGAQWTVTSQFRGRTRTNPDGSPLPDPVQRYVDEVVIHGSPQRVADEVLRLREEIGLDYLMIAPFSHESFLLFTNEVIPLLARQAYVTGVA
ncbi:MAG TPA: LLM class flavin-dependent oxidoreductase [Dehalococcoidia bacterium]|jgi:alkanesulfonate monooxygenase SsuD/methylene tetrahydromethanopterin reductase-like flavin-dependent oxidoreductase (luciferase family)|nr:LLM class flavin-dependent oxidoreductase [Dehalococcoidia bacterium]